MPWEVARTVGREHVKQCCGPLRARRCGRMHQSTSNNTRAEVDLARQFTVRAGPREETPPDPGPAAGLPHVQRPAGGPHAGASAIDRTPPLTIDEAAKRLGVTERLVRRLVSERRIGFVRIGKFVRIRQEDIDAYVAANFQAPEPERTDRPRGFSR